LNIGKDFLSYEKLGKFTHPFFQGTLEVLKNGDPVKSRKYPRIVIPVKTGIQRFQSVTKSLDTGFHRCDDFLRGRQK